MIMHLAILLIGVFACSTAVILIKASAENALLLAAYRLLVAAVALTPVYLRDRRRHAARYARAPLKQAVAPGILLGAHFISWIIAARMTGAANASLIVNLVPVAMPFLLHFLVRETVTAGEARGTVVALCGLLLLGAADFRVAPEYLWGDVLCLASMLVFAGYLALGRLNRDIPTTWLYVVPLYYTAAAFCFAVALFAVNPIKPYPPREVALILALGIVPTVLGHSSLNYAMKHVRGQVVSIVNMGQFVFAGVMAFFLLGEVPPPAFYAASALLIGGALLAIRRRDA